MAGFIKQSTTEIQKKYKLDGYKKTAILLAEIGLENSKEILDNLNLTDKQLKKIRKATVKLGKYNPKNSKMVKRELLVLSETLNYGKAKGIFNPDEEKNSFVDENKKGISKMIEKNPNEIASLLKNWLSN